MKKSLKIWLCVWALAILPACNPAIEYSSEPLAESTIYLAEGINSEKIQFIWMELPSPIEPGVADVRLFLAKHDPPEPTIPNPNGLRCSLSENETALLGPERVPFEFEEDGTFVGSYTYKACPECVDCYMNWDYTLEMSGVQLDDTVSLDIAIKHFGLNVQGDYVSAELGLAGDPNQEPHIICDQSVACKEIKFVKR